jgi:hypothetical protein
VFFKFDESMLQASCIELGDGKHAYAALRAAGTAHEPGAAAAAGVGQGGVDDLDEFLVARRQVHRTHDLRILC